MRCDAGMAEDKSLSEFEVALAHMARDLLAQETAQDTLDRIAAYAVELVDGCEHAGILVLRPGNRVETAAATSDLVREIDDAQRETAEGPCFDALEHSLPVQRIMDMEAYGEPWPNFAPRASELGVGSMIGLLLYTDEGGLGALDLYSSQRDAFTERSERVGWLLASHAAVLYAAARTQSQLETAMDSRKDIGEALGLVMATYQIDENYALKLLKQVSQNRNVKLRELAQAINSGDISL